MKKSKWVDWKIECCLKNITRKNRTSHTNGVVGVIMKVDGGYDWLVNHLTNCHGISVINFKDDKFFPIIHKNHFNSNPPKWRCKQCETYEWLNGSYIEYIEEETFFDYNKKFNKT